ncbi:MAG: VTT domain-containing protein [Clostridia bacterium]|nr:VTT domain-containing protein [Clostridia bacterium]
MKRKERNKAENTAALTEEDLAAKKLLKRKRVIAIASLLICVGLIVWLAIVVTKSFLSIGEGETIGDAAGHFRDMIRGYGAWGVAIAFGIQVLQVVVSPIPGEVIETGMGLTYGWFWGAVIILAGAAFSAWLIMLFVRKFGTKFVELFISLDKINDLKFINSEEKLHRWVLILYMLPGTPKDPLIFFFGLTRIKISSFVVLSTIARIPSVITSTIGGQWIQEKKYWAAAALYIAVGAVSLACILIYKKIMDKMRGKGKKPEDAPEEGKPDETPGSPEENAAAAAKEEENGSNDTRGIQIGADSAPDAGGDKEG